LSAVIFSLIGPGIGSMNHSLGADLVRASCGLVVPYDPQKLYVDAKDVVERCAVRAAPGILYSIAAYRILSEVEFDDKFCQQLYLCTEKFCIKFAEYLFQGTAKGRDMELFSVALLNFGFCNAAREQIKKMSDICYTTVTDVTIEQLLENMATISTKMYQNITGYKSEEYKAGYII
ncbi:hypothetical protein ADUPG1_002911, partial [Aduncisulcus paluster]